MSSRSRGCGYPSGPADASYDRRLYGEDARAVVVLLPPLAGLETETLRDPSILSAVLDDAAAARIDNAPATLGLYTSAPLIHNQLPEEIGRLPASQNGSLVAGAAQTPYISTQAHVLLMNDTPGLERGFWEKKWKELQDESVRLPVVSLTAVRQSHLQRQVEPVHV